jgi:hypothetical protein
VLVVQFGVFLSLPALAGADRIIGLTEDELITCTGFPAAQMQVNGKTFYKFALTSEGGAAVPAGKHPAIWSTSERVLRLGLKTAESPA